MSIELRGRLEIKKYGVFSLYLYNNQVYFKSKIKC